MSGKYDDIIKLPHHVSKTRPRMPAMDRAAQFAPFAALTGHGAAIAETARLTQERRALDEHEQEALNQRLNQIREQAGSHPAVTIVYFKPDERKAGGAYVTVRDYVKKFDAYAKRLLLENGERIPFEDIMAIENGRS